MNNLFEPYVVKLNFEPHRHIGKTNYVNPMCPMNYVVHPKLALKTIDKRIRIHDKRYQLYYTNKSTHR